MAASNLKRKVASTRKNYEKINKRSSSASKEIASKAKPLFKQPT